MQCTHLLLAGYNVGVVDDDDDDEEEEDDSISCLTPNPTTALDDDITVSVSVTAVATACSSSVLASMPPYKPPKPDVMPNELMIRCMTLVDVRIMRLDTRVHHIPRILLMSSKLLLLLLSVIIDHLCCSCTWRWGKLRR